MSREITIVTPENVEVRFELAGLISRFTAMLIDSLLQALAIVVLALAAWGLFAGFSFSFNTTPPTWLLAVLILLLFLLWNGYFLYFEARRNGQTPGKKAVGVRVILDTGHPLDFRGALLRNVMRSVDSLPSMYCVGFISAFVSPEYRRLGDYVAGTLVINTWASPRPAPQPVEPEPMPEQAQDSPDGPLLPLEALPYLREVTRDDYRTVRHFLHRRKELDDNVALDLAKKLTAPLAAKLHIELEVIEDPAVFLSNLAEEWERRMIH